LALSAKHPAKTSIFPQSFEPELILRDANGTTNGRALFFMLSKLYKKLQMLNGVMDSSEGLLYNPTLEC
jgi:hypothetical protein